MNKVQQIQIACLAMVSSLALLIGCSRQTIDSAEHDAAQDAQVVRREAKRAERKAEPQLKMLDIGARA